MKSTLKISALIVAFAGLTLGAKAQTSTTTTKTSTSSNGVILSIGADAGIPTGNLSDSYNWSIGGSVQADIPVISNQLYVTINAGYNSIQGKNNIPFITPNGASTFDATNIQLLPVKAGLKYFIVPHFYVQGEAGAAFALNKSDVGFDKSAAFLYAPQIGYQFPLGGKSFLDAGVRYEGTTKFNDADAKVNFFGLRVAYAFGI
ncbi:MAG TPA: hypothetical protein VIM55_20710 [Mucilaginibacter sp.]